jgi:hypothetical protein
MIITIILKIRPTGTPKIFHLTYLKSPHGQEEISSIFNFSLSF